MSKSSQAPIPGTPGLLRRLVAMVYDAFLLIALFALVSLPIVLALGGEHGINDNWPARVLYRLVLLLTAFAFFGWFWTHGGQTLGMRAWRLQTLKLDGSAMDWASAAKRFLAAILSWASLGLGYLWMLIDHDRLTWHDRLSGTRVVLLPKKTS